MSEAQAGTTLWWPSPHSSRLADVLEGVHNEQVADADFEKLCKDCFEALQEMCSQALSKPEFKVEPFDWTPDVQLEVFGSTRQGTALKSSDLDVRMTFEQFEVHDSQRQVRYLKGIAEAPGEKFDMVKLITGRVSLLRMRFDGKLDVDLTMGGTFENGDLSADTIGVDHYIKAVLAAAVDEEATRRFVRLVKVFAKANGLVDAHLGFLSSTSWTLMAINFLQSQKCLPPANQVVVSAGENESGEPKEPRRKKRRLWSCRPSLGLLMRFLAYVESCGAEPHRISVLKGEHWSSPTNWWGNESHPLFLEYPSERRMGVNVAMTLTPKNWQATVSCCRKARESVAPKETGTWESREGEVKVELARLLRSVEN